MRGKDKKTGTMGAKEAIFREAREETRSRARVEKSLRPMSGTYAE